MRRASKYNFCRSSFLYNNLQSYKDKVLVFDTRDSYLFVGESVSQAINISKEQLEDTAKQQKIRSADLDALTLTDISKCMDEDELKRFSQRKRDYCIIIMSEASLPKEFISRVEKSTNNENLSDFFAIPQDSIKEDFMKATDEMEEKESVSLGIRLFDLLQQDVVRQLYIMVDGAENFFKYYPYMNPSFHSSPYAFIRSISLQTTDLDVTYNFPHDILGHRLFLGSFNQASQEIIVNSLDITHIVNVTAECENVYEEKGIEYLHIVILDESEVDLSKYFEKAYKFIEEALAAGEKNRILVHCAMGKSRSATITIMFLMKKFNWTFQQALEYVKMKRRHVDPNYGFLQQLEHFEEVHYAF